MGGDDFIPQEADRAKVIADLRLDDGRVQAFAGVIVHEERTVRAELRAEETGRSVSQHVPLPARDIEAVDVGTAGGSDRLATGFSESPSIRSDIFHTRTDCLPSTPP